MIPIQPAGNNFPLFGIPEFLLYSEIGKHISKDQPFYSIEHSPYDSVTDVVNHYVREIKKSHPHGPYGLMGYCNWGEVILKIADRLIEEDEKVPVIVLTEYYSPSIRLSKFSFKFFLQKIKFILKNLYDHGSLTSKKKFLSKQFVSVLKFMNRKFKGSNKKVNPASTPIPKTYSGKVILFQASETYGYKEDSHMGWKDKFTGDVKKFVIEGEHIGMMVSPVAAAQMAEILNKELQKINTVNKA